MANEMPKWMQINLFISTHIAPIVSSFVCFHLVFVHIFILLVVIFCCAVPFSVSALYYFWYVVLIGDFVNIHITTDIHKNNRIYSCSAFIFMNGVDACAVCVTFFFFLLFLQLFLFIIGLQMGFRF